MAGRPSSSRVEPGEPVLDRAFRLLMAFTAVDKPLSLTSLSVRTGLPKSTAFRLATRLVDLGALERDDEGGYSVGLRLYEIASLAPRGQGLKSVALPFLEDLHLATGQHVLLAIRDQCEAVIVERLSSRTAGRVMYRVGGRTPLHATGVGMALLAHAPAGVQARVLAGTLALEPEGLVTAAGDVRRQLAQIRRDGVAVLSRPLPQPMTSVAAPVFGARRDAVAALSVIFPTGSVAPTAIRPAVIATSRALSRALAPLRREEASSL